MLKGRLEHAEEWINKLEDKEFEIIKLEEQKFLVNNKEEKSKPKEFMGCHQLEHNA